VIALAGNSRLPAAFRTFSLLKQVPKNTDQPGPAKLQDQIPIKSVIFDE